jgi:hypothetical protein
MACNNLGLFALDTSASLNLCLSALTTTVYGDSLVIGEEMYIDSGCTMALASIYLSNGSNLYSTNSFGEITGITGCSCNFLGNFSSASTPELSCLSPLDYTLYGSDLNIGSIVYTNSACTSTALNSYYSDGVDVYDVDSAGEILGISTCTCTGTFCVQNDTTYDDTYEIAGTYVGQSYYTGESTGYVIYYSTGETRWCLAQNLGDPCDQFGPYGSTSTCPDLDDSVLYFGPCTTTTTTFNPCSTLDLEAVFDCYIPPTPSITPTKTPSPTPTMTPTSSAICGGVSMVVSKLGITPTPTPSFTPTPTPTPVIVRPCNFPGEVTFNSINEIIQCSNSKKFKDCFTGLDYFTSEPLLVSGSTSSPKEGYVYNAIINGQGYCVIFEGLYENISGVDNIQLINEVGSANSGACLQCNAVTSPTPTQTQTPTPTPTPTASPCVSYQYRITNNSPSSIKLGYVDCIIGSKTILLGSLTSTIVCSTTTPTSTNPQNIEITNLGFVC